jgi:putative copper export protein
VTGASVAPEATDRPAGRGAPLGWAAVALGSAVLAAGATGGLSGGMPAVLAATLTRAAMDVAGVACVGTVLLALLAPGHAGAAVPVLRGAASVWLGAGLLDLVFRTALVTGRPVTEVQPPDLVAFVTGPAAGSGLVTGATAAALVLGCSIAGPLGAEHGPGPAWLTLGFALVGLAGPAATGHAAGSGDLLPVVAILLHAPAAALWVGGLAAILVVAGRRDVLLAALPRFSRLAGVCIAVLAVTGVVGATARISAVPELVSAYGALLAAKAACLLVAGLLGGLTRRRLRAGRTPVLVWAGVEVLVLAVAVGLAGTLSQTA